MRGNATDEHILIAAQSESVNSAMKPGLLIMEKILKNKAITVKILAVLVFADLLETFTHFCFKKSVCHFSDFQIAAFSDAIAFVKAVVFIPYLWLGLLSVLATFIVWSTILSRIDLSVAVPVCSFSYITVPIVSMVFLNEQISLLRWTGILFILTGVILVSISSKHSHAGEP